MSTPVHTPRIHTLRCNAHRWKSGAGEWGTKRRQGVRKKRESREAGRPWLGQMSTDGQWEIRRRAVDEAIDAILGDLVAAGLVCAFPGDAAGKGAGTLYCAANRYVRGEPFPIDRRRQEEKEKEPERLRTKKGKK